MPVESAADRAVFVAADDFGVAATYTPAVGSAATVAGIFSAAETDQFSEPGMVSGSPRFICRTADLPAAAAAGDEITIAGTDYTVQVIRDDGTGMTDLQLEEAA